MWNYFAYYLIYKFVHFIHKLHQRKATEYDHFPIRFNNLKFKL